MFESLKHRIYGTPLLLAAALSPLLLTGCITDSDSCPVDTTRGDGTWLSMRVVNADSRQGRTRADVDVPVDPDKHPDETADAAERHIDTRDITIMLLDNKKMVRHIFAPEEITMVPVGQDAVNGYDLKFKLNSDYFSYATSMTNVDFSIMVVANRNGLGGTPATFGTDMLSKTPLMIAEGYPSFTMPGQSTEAWMPNKGTNRIPMSGIMTATGMNLSESNTEASALDLGTIYLQRNLCKVRILDDLNGHPNGPSDYNQITSVKLVGSSNEGAFIPLLPSETDTWYTNTTVLETPTVKGGENGWWNATAEVVMKQGSQTSVVNHKNNNYTWDNAFYCYIPEAVLKDTEAKLVITADYKDPANTDVKTWELPLGKDFVSGGTNTPATPSFVRNHIYEYLVQATSGSASLSVKWVVCEMNTGIINIPPFE